MSDDDIREAGIAVYKAVWDNSFKGAALGNGEMWSSPEHSIGKHAGQLGDYRANLRVLDGSKKIEAGLLVEISGNFSDLILFNDGEIASNRNGLLPLSDGFFERLFKALGACEARIQMVIERQGILLRSGAVRCIFL